MEIKMHKVQARILKKLLFKPNSRFSDLNAEGLTSDHFTFHIKKLVGAGLVEKNASKYRLTIKGKEFANMMDTDSLKFEKQAKVAVRIVPTRKGGGETEYLMQQRLKEPFFGIWGFPGGKVAWGETIHNAAIRELFEETGLKGKLVLKGIEHKLDETTAGKLLEDKLFFIFTVNNPKGDLKLEVEGCKNKWVRKDKISSMKKFGDVNLAMNMVNSRTLKFFEKTYKHRIEKY